MLCGATAVEQLRSNLAAREVTWHDEVGERLLAAAEPPEACWSQRFRMPWN